MPVTRSATRAAERNTTKTSTTKVTQAKAVQPSSLSATREAGEGETSFNTISPRQRLLEWLSLKDVSDGVTPDNGRLFSLLQELYQQKGCQAVARGRPRELSGIEWLIIEWQNSAVREKFLASELYLKLEEVLAHRLWKRELVWPIHCMDFGRIISAKPSFPPQKLYEVLTVYLPADLDDTTVSSLEEFRGLPHWHDEAELEPTEDRPKSPMAGFLSQKRGWIDGRIEYRGQGARRLVYFWKFEDEEAERHYKENMRWGRRIRNGRAIWEVMEHFLDDLEKLGMLGYESLHVRFLEVVDYVPENASISPLPSLPLVITLTAEQEAYFKMLDEQEGDL